MVAVPEERILVHPVSPADPSGRSEPVAGRRVVAVAGSATELLRPRSDLARLLESFDRVDLLLVADEHEHGGGVVALPVAGAPAVDPVDFDEQWDDRDCADECADEDDDDPAAVLDRAVAALGLADVTVHRLGLAPTFGGEAESDIVAALSELVGFDPEPGVYCLAPAAENETAGCPVTRAARRIAQVYGLPLLSYRCMELSVVADGPLER